MIWKTIWTATSDRNFGHVHPAKIQISLRIRAVLSESSLGALWIDKGAKCLHADDKDSDQTARNLVLVGSMSEDTFVSMLYI